jgi:hypothetical protein
MEGTLSSPPGEEAGERIDPMSRKFSSAHLEKLDHFDHIKAGHM